MKPFSKLALSCVLCMRALPALTTNWIDGTGDWNTGGNWNNGVPSGTDTAQINNGGTAQLTAAPQGMASTVNLGTTGTSSNILVDSQPLTVNGLFSVGTGSVTIQNVGAVSATGILLGTNISGVGGTLLLDGVGSTLTTTAADFTVGLNTPSTATIQNGGVATTISGTIAALASSSLSTVNVKDSGSLWKVTTVNGLKVGRDKNGFLNISNGGQVQSLDSIIAFNLNSVSTTTVTDPGSLWAVTGTLAVGQAGNGTLTISNAQVTTTGITTLAVAGVGNLNINNGGILTVPQLAAGAGAPSAIFDGATLQANASNTSFITGFSGTQLDIQSALDIDSQAFNIGTNNPLSGVGSLTKAGTGILTLSGTNTYSGGTTISGGTLQPTTTASLPTNGNLTLAVSGVTLDLSTAVISPTIGDLTDAIGGSFILLGGSSLTFGTANSTTVASAISGSGGSLTKQGSSTVVFTGTNTYSGGTTINAGTLQINTTSSLPSGGNVNMSGATAILDLSPPAGSFTIGDLSGVAGSQVTLGSSNLTLGTSNSTTFAGSFTGAGTLTKIGTGTLSLPNASGGYTGSVLLNNGILSIGNTASLGGSNDLTFQINNGNTLQATASFAIPQTVNLSTNGFIDTQANTLTLNGGVAGSGSLTKIGTGTLSLPTANGGYTGSTFLTNGTLSISNATSLGSGSLTFQTNPGNTLQAGGSPTITNPLFLNVDGNIDSNGNFLNLNGPITGAGSLTKVGAGTVELSSLANNYGGTFINNGLLQVTGSITGPVTVNAGTFSVQNSFTITDWTGAPGSLAMIDIGTTLTFGTANSTTFAGVISDSGNLVKQGSGTVTFTGANTYTGTTLVNAGTLVINGSITSPTTVAAGATLKGTGTIASSLTVNGTLRPGNSVGTINVLGPVTFNAGSTYAEELNPSQASLLNVTGGNVTINPNVTLAIIPNPGTYAPGSTYTIIQTAGGFGVAGTFSNVTDTLPLLQFTVSYTPNTVVLNLAKKPGGFSNLVTGGNAGAVAICLDRASPTPGSDFDNVLNQLLSVTTDETLEHDLNQLQPSQYNALELSQENVNTRIFSVLNTRMGQIHRACRPNDETWSVWADGFGDFQQQKHQQGEHGFHTATGAALFGFDGHASPHLHVGAGGAYTATHLKWGGAHGTGDLSSGYGFAYGTWHVRHLFLDASFVGGYNNYDAKRHIGFLAVDRDAKSEHHGYTLAGRLLGGFPFKVWKTEVAPLISLDYDFVHQTSFKEHGAKSLNLHVHEKNANLLRAEAGFRVTRRCPPELKMDPCTKKESCVSDIYWLPSLQLTVIREWRFQGEKTKSRLQGVDCNFIVRGLNPDRTLISPVISSTWLFRDDTIGVTLDYVGEFDVDGKYWDQKANLQISYAF